MAESLHAREVAAVHARHVIGAAIAALTIAASLAGCTGRNAGGYVGPPTQSPLASSSETGRSVSTDVVQTGHPRGWRKLVLPTTSQGIEDIISGGLGNYMWITDYSDSTLIRLSYDGSTTTVPLVIASPSGPRAFSPIMGTFGADHRLFISGLLQGSRNYAVAIVGGSGVEGVSLPPSGDTPAYSNFVLGPDGKVWFVETAHVASIGATGIITEYAFPSGISGSSSTGIAVGADGKIWFSEGGAGSSSSYSMVANIDPTTGHIVEYPLGVNCGPIFSMVGTPGGRIYASCNVYDSEDFLEISPSGRVTVKAHLQLGGSVQGNMALGPGGTHIWFVRGDSYSFGTYDLRSGAFGRVIPPPQLIAPLYLTLTLGPDQNIWALVRVVSSSQQDFVAVRTLTTLIVTPGSLTLEVGGTRSVVVKYTGSGVLSAASLDRSVAKLTRTGTTSFLVRGIAPGTTSVIVEDTLHNSFSVAVKVS